MIHPPFLQGLEVLIPVLLVHFSVLTREKTTRMTDKHAR